VIAATAGWLTVTRTVRRAGLPADGAASATLTAVHQTWLGSGRYATQFAAPVLAAALLRPGGSTMATRWGRRAAAASLLLGPAIEAWRASSLAPAGAPESTAADSVKPAPSRPARTGLRPMRCMCAHIADDISYGVGVWTGCARERTLAPLLPRISWRPLRVSGPASTSASTREGKAADGQRLV
jgi:hypothetical protein